MLWESLHRAGFDLPATTPADNKPAANRNALQLDSTRTFNAYGLNGSGDSTPVLRSTYQYPQPGVKVEFNAQYENNQWQMLDRITLTSMINNVWWRFWPKPLMRKHNQQYEAERSPT